MCPAQARLCVDVCSNWAAARLRDLQLVEYAGVEPQTQRATVKSYLGFQLCWRHISASKRVG